MIGGFHLNQNIIRDVIVPIDMKKMGRVINTRATFNQRDVNTAVLICKLKMDDNINLTNCVVVAEILKPDNTKVILQGTIIDHDNGVVALGLTSQCLSVIGTVKCKLSIRSNTQTLYAPVLLFSVVNNLFDISDDNIISQDEYPILTQLIVQTQELGNKINELEILINTNEIERQNNEDIRISNETSRQSYIDDVKITLTNMINDFNSKIQLIDVKMLEIDSILNSKILEVNKKIDAVNEIMDRYDVTFNRKITEVNETITNCNNVVDDKVKIINQKLSLVDSKMYEVNETISDANKKVNTAIDKLTTEVNNSIQTMNNTVNMKVQEVNEAIARSVNTVDSKCDEVDVKMGLVNQTVQNIEVNESLRNKAETERQNRFNKLINDNEITSSDIDDILSMIGGTL